MNKFTVTWDAEIDGVLEFWSPEESAFDIDKDALKGVISNAIVDGSFHVKEIRIHDVMPVEGR